jgi:hypothetical protein
MATVTTLDLGGAWSLRRVRRIEAGFRSGWLRHIGVAIGGASGAAAALGCYESVAAASRTRASNSLQGWGPAFSGGHASGFSFVLGKVIWKA